MVSIRPYVDTDWEAILQVCLASFSSIHGSFQDLLGNHLFALVYPDWKASHKEYLRSLTSTSERKHFLVVEENGSIVGFIHYEMDNKKRGTIGLNAVHPSRQGKGIGTFMYEHVLQIMREHGTQYVSVSTGGDPSHTAARRAYEKLGFVPIPVANYYKTLLNSGSVSSGQGSAESSKPGSRLVIVCGLPGSGKTSYSKQIEPQFHAVRFNADEWLQALGMNLWESEIRDRVEALQWEMAQQILSSGGNAIIEWGTWGKV
jgi:ribosomal protein S18 acetylase RimI-like enzyme